MKKKSKKVKLFLYDMNKYLLAGLFPRGSDTTVTGRMIDAGQTSVAWDLGTKLDSLVDGSTIVVDEVVLPLIDVIIGAEFERTLIKDVNKQTMYVYRYLNPPTQFSHIQQWPTQNALKIYGVTQ